MDLTIPEVATLLGKTERAVRAQLARGTLRGHKRGGRWLVARHHLPLTAREHARLAGQVATARAAVERAIPEPLRAPRAGVTENAVFAEVLALVRGRTAASEPPTAPDVALSDALQSIAEAHFEFDKGRKLAALRRARGRLAHALALFVVDVRDEAATIEATLMPRMAGLIRWAERLPRAREP